MSPTTAFLIGTCATLSTAVPLAFWLGRRSLGQDDFPADRDPYAEPHGDNVHLVGVGIGLAILTAAGVVAGVSIGFAHEAPSGWSYDYSCCASFDCHPALAGDIEITPNGLHVPASGETIPYSDPRVKPSGDGAMHRCSYGGVPSAKTICIYVPGGV
ncbi:hypothetical protein KHC28_00210 [Ancylobacter sonchi]|uniref:hypothetical protein n=1 Tax=Ancylobacter sonchi TaxID=1937790 RepID=UPI001BD5DFFC|nr:hypothetical protein [Ancylobacter sonchi]MBS7532087.1 hypothetical protein [Ancylobacter sonchi]